MTIPGIQSDSPEDDRIQRIPIEVLPFWDLSKKPITNDRTAKFGSGGTLSGQAIEMVSEESGRRKFFDGLEFMGMAGDPAPYSAKANMEPDNWVLRFHEADGRGDLSQWAIRDIADHTNYADQRECRGTMVIDQESDQGWAWRSDMEWLVDLGTAVSDKELVFNGAGFLSCLYEGDITEYAEEGEGGEALQAAAYRRMALAINMAGNAGYLTQGSQIGQLHHIIHLVSSGGGTVAAGGRPSIQTEAALRGDVHFDINGALAQFVDEKEDTKENEYDEPREVHFYVTGIPAPDLGQDAADDPMSNHPKIDRQQGVMWRGWVKVPKPSGGSPTKHPYSWHSKPPEKPGSGGGATTATESGHGQLPPSANGAGTGNPDGTPPDPTRNTNPAVPTYDPGKYIPDGHGGLIPNPAAGEILAVQCQYGSAMATSPGWSQSFNILPHETDTDVNPSAHFYSSKAAGCRDISGEFMFKVSEQIAAGERVTVDIKMMAYLADTPQEMAEVYGRAVVLDDTTPYAEDTAWQRVNVFFSGFPIADELVVHWWVERRCDDRTLDPTYDANVEVWIMRSWATGELD